ncbi:MAG: thioredoxin [Clostridiales bacterium]|nr:thioredoxin [Clostridiales bacterium]
MATIKFTKENFETEALKSDVPVLIDFYADWCGPCRMVSPIVEQIAAEGGNYKVGTIDVDRSPELAARYGVMSIPTLIVLKDGKVAQQAVGARSKQQILQMLQ